MATSAPPKISFSLKGKAKQKNEPPKGLPGAAFASMDEDEQPSAARPSKVSLVPTSAVMTKAMKKQIEDQKKIDATVYQYDEVWDYLKEAERQAEQAKEEEALTRQPRYINGLLEAAELRKRDHLIAEEKMIQREREREGDEFEGTEKFVTQAYKDQQIENRKAEEQEKLREELNKKKKGFGSSGMNHMYRNMLQQSEQKHAAIVAATSKAIIGPSPMDESANFAIRPPTEAKELSDLDKARQARAKGKDVELNDDNQIVDKRELLAAGLNLSGKNTRDLASLRRNKDSNGEHVVVHTAVGVAASRKEIEARRKREIEDQLAEEKQRVALQKQKAEEESRERAVKRKNDDDAVEEARRRYLERKRRKLEEPTPMDE